MITCIGCQWHFRSEDTPSEEPLIKIDRFDKIEATYLITGDFAALQQMKTGYPIQTRTLIEDVLSLGPVDTLDINTKFLLFFQDSILQVLIKDVQRNYADMEDVNRQLSESFSRLRHQIPHLEIPQVYTQISSLDESIIVGQGMLGISLDKYLGEDYPLYKHFGYTDKQRKMMTKSYIVPDCLCFYLLSLYHKDHIDNVSHDQRCVYLGRVQYVVNQIMAQHLFDGEYVARAEAYMKQHPQTTIDDLLAEVN